MRLCTVHVCSTVVHVVLLYGCEMWPVRAADERMLAVFENESIIRTLHVKHRDCAPTVELQLTPIAGQIAQ